MGYIYIYIYGYGGVGFESKPLGLYYQNIAGPERVKPALTEPGEKKRRGLFEIDWASQSQMGTRPDQISRSF